MLELVRVTLKDKDKITEILTASFNEDSKLYFGQDVLGGPPGYDNGEIASKVISNRNSHAYFVYHHQEKIAFISINTYHREIDYFCVLPAYMNQGYGSQIWLMMENIYGEQDWMLETPSYSKRNHHFYEKLGFKKVGEKEYSMDTKSFIFKK